MQTISPGDTEVVINHITHRYSGTFKAVDDVSASLGGHNVTGLLGANGAGIYIDEYNMRCPYPYIG